jgi:outer membrane receptor for ferrienterochelin and colicin
MIRSGMGMRGSIFCGMLVSLSVLPLYAGEEASDESVDLSLTDLINVKVVVASKTEEKISEAPGVISVVTSGEMARFGARTLKDDHLYRR